MYLLCSFANSCRCAVLTAACATSTSMPPSNRRLRPLLALHRAPSGGTLVSRRNLHTIPVRAFKNSV